MTNNMLAKDCFVETDEFVVQYSGMVYGTFQEEGDADMWAEENIDDGCYTVTQLRAPKDD